MAHAPQAGKAAARQPRGRALGNLVISNASYPPRAIAADKDTGKVVWETNLSEGQVNVQLPAAPLPVKDKIIVGAGGDRGVRDYNTQVKING
jgi:outer membrane protein assembly factor BamB